MSGDIKGRGYDSMKDLRVVALEGEAKKIERGVKMPPEKLADIAGRLVALRKEFRVEFFNDDTSKDKKSHAFNQAVQILHICLVVVDRYFDNPAIKEIQNDLIASGAIEFIREPELRDRSLRDILKIGNIPRFVEGFIPSEAGEELVVQLNNEDDIEVIRRACADVIFENLDDKVEEALNEEEPDPVEMQHVIEQYGVVIFNLKMYPHNLFDSLSEFITLKDEALAGSKLSDDNKDYLFRKSEEIVVLINAIRELIIDSKARPYENDKQDYD